MFNLEEDFKSMSGKILSLRSQLDELEERNKRCYKNTEDILKGCQTVGIKIVSIGVETELVPSSINFSFGASGSVFAEGDYKGRPAVRSAIPEKIGSCGNSGQKQLNTNDVIEGVYRFQGGKRKKL